jgi:Uncharacterized conserved protein (COG2071)
VRIPVIKGVIKRRLLVNFRADPAVVQHILPHPFRPKTHGGYSIVGICLIRLESLRPSGLPGIFGIASENAAHRVSVEWTDACGARQEGVYIPRRDTSSVLNRLVGGRLFPGEHHPAEFRVLDDGTHIEISMHSLDGTVSVHVAGDDSGSLPSSSCFRSLKEASAFFEGGSLGYSATRGGNRLDGLFLRTIGWKVGALSVAEVQSSYFSDEARFPMGSVEFDHALVMRDVAHEWCAAADLFTQNLATDPSRDPSSAPGTLPGPQVARQG